MVLTVLYSQELVLRSQICVWGQQVLQEIKTALLCYGLVAGHYFVKQPLPSHTNFGYTAYPNPFPATKTDRRGNDKSNKKKKYQIGLANYRVEYTSTLPDVAIANTSADQSRCAEAAAAS